VAPECQPVRCGTRLGAGCAASGAPRRSGPERAITDIGAWHPGDQLALTPVGKKFWSETFNHGIAVSPAPTFHFRVYVRAGTRPGGRPTFLLVQESRQRSTPRLPGLTASDSPRCGRPAGPVAKLAGQKTAAVGQRDRTSPGKPSSLGGSEGK
jgi:hypothetical protein